MCLTWFQDPSARESPVPSSEIHRPRPIELRSHAETGATRCDAVRAGRTEARAPGYTDFLDSVVCPSSCHRDTAPTAARLGRAKLPIGKRLRQLDVAVPEVDAIPSKRKDFTDSHSGQKRDQHNRSTGIFQMRQKCSELQNGPQLLLLFWFPFADLERFGGVGFEIPLLAFPATHFPHQQSTTPASGYLESINRKVRRQVPVI